MADKAGSREEKDKRGGRLRLQIAYGNALIATHGQGAPETSSAFERAGYKAPCEADVG